jgi:TonB family protein
MKTARNLFCIIVISLFASHFVSAQKKETISVDSLIDTKSNTKLCRELRAGKAMLLPEPKYPADAKSAKIGGTIQVSVLTDESGNVLEIEKISGNKILQGASIISAMKSKFVPTLCDGVKIRVSATITYTFLSGALTENYVSITKIEDFADVKTDSEFYAAILDLTENYKLAYGYADGNFHAESSLTRGDFVEFLRLTLDTLSVRAKFANKNLRESGVYSSFNPQKITLISKIKELNSKAPYFDSVKLLLQNYDIVLTNENLEFQGAKALTQNELIDLWKQIFGEDAVPVNFTKTENFERVISRGDFAVFLQESLGVLTYKLLPQ